MPRFYKTQVELFGASCAEFERGLLNCVAAVGQLRWSPMTLEKQLAELNRLGLNLADGVTIDDLLYSFGRQEYEKKPFDLILFVLGIEVERKPWGRPICSRVWNFDTECINGTGDYV
jgi:hypothetical protein